MKKENPIEKDNLGEIVSLRDESTGFVSELRSSVLDIDKLLSLAKDGFCFLKNQRSNKSRMVGVD